MYKYFYKWCFYFIIPYFGFRSKELKIDIPEQDTCNLPQLESFKNSRLLSIMDYSTATQDDRGSICETACSSLTGMCVSDEENTVLSLDIACLN